jgi:hypothetical protein
VVTYDDWNFKVHLSISINDYSSGSGETLNYFVADV